MIKMALIDGRTVYVAAGYVVSVLPTGAENCEIVMAFGRSMNVALSAAAVVGLVDAEPIDSI